MEDGERSFISLPRWAFIPGFPAFGSEQPGLPGPGKRYSGIFQFLKIICRIESSLSHPPDFIGVMNPPGRVLPNFEMNFA